jgi:hypothetical protein
MCFLSLKSTMNIFDGSSSPQYDDGSLFPSLGNASVIFLAFESTEREFILRLTHHFIILDCKDDIPLPFPRSTTEVV